MTSSRSSSSSIRWMYSVSACSSLRTLLSSSFIFTSSCVLGDLVLARLLCRLLLLLDSPPLLSFRVRFFLSVDPSLSVLCTGIACDCSIVASLAAVRLLCIIGFVLKLLFGLSSPLGVIAFDFFVPASSSFSLFGGGSEQTCAAGFLFSSATAAMLLRSARSNSLTRSSFSSDSSLPKSTSVVIAGLDLSSAIRCSAPASVRPLKLRSTSTSCGMCDIAFASRFTPSSPISLPPSLSSVTTVFFLSALARALDPFTPRQA
mmetsp:Transcript_18323/g.70784  ORF Transcript_18323/g.70784 Transcript_18323/m.70784 type:complete len:260 (-) Transcript_18323:197-976(-)